MWSAITSQAIRWNGLGILSTSGFVPNRYFKVVSALQRRCNDCRIVRRGKKVYVLCNENPRHKQRQGRGRSVYRQNP